MLKHSLKSRVCLGLLVLLLLQPLCATAGQPSSSFDNASFVSMLKEGDERAEQGDFKQAVLIFEHALDYAKATNAPDYKIANAEGLLGEMYSCTGRNAEAEKLLQHAIYVMSMEIPPVREGVAFFSHSLSIVYADQGRFGESVTLNKKAVAIYETYFKNSKNLNRSFALALSDLGSTLEELGQFEKAKTYYDQSISVSKRFSGKSKATYPIILIQTSWYYTHQGDYDKAAKMILEAIVLFKKLNSPKIIEAESYLAWVSFLKGQYTEAEALYDKTLKDEEKRSGKNSYPYLIALVNKSKILAEQGKFDPARPLIQEAQDLNHANHFPTMTGDILYVQALIAQHDKDYVGSERDLLAAIQAEQVISGNTHRHIVRYHKGLAKLYAEQGKTELAIENYQEAINIQQKLGPATHPEMQKLQSDLAELTSKTPQSSNAAQ